MRRSEDLTINPTWAGLHWASAALVARRRPGAAGSPPVVDEDGATTAKGSSRQRSPC